MKCSRSAALCTVLGITTGILIHTTIVITGLSAFSNRFPDALNLIWIAGACYLGWLGARLIAGALKPPKAVALSNCNSESPTESNHRAAYVQGLVTNLTNPKVFLFFTTILSATLRSEAGYHRGILFGSIIVAEALLLWSVFVIFLQWPPVARNYAKATRWIDTVFGALLLWIAATVLWRLA